MLSKADVASSLERDEEAKPHNDLGRGTGGSCEQATFLKHTAGP